jgi:hypothetical protein
VKKLNYNRPSFRSPGKTYESIDGSDLPREFWGSRPFRKGPSKTELRREADEAFRQFTSRKLVRDGRQSDRQGRAHAIGKQQENGK